MTAPAAGRKDEMMDINSYSYAPHMLDGPRDDEQDMAICADCANLIDGLCAYKKSNCTFAEIIAE